MSDEEIALMVNF